MSEAAPTYESAGLLRRMLRPLIGDIQWRAPGWLRGIGNAIAFCAIALASCATFKKDELAQIRGQSVPPELGRLNPV